MTPYVLLAVVAGLLLPLQALINARLSSQLTGALSAAFGNFAVGLAAIICIFAVAKFPVPTAAQINNTPWWAWVGGLFGAFFIFAAAVTIPKLGAAGMFATIIAAQLLSSLIFDHFGVLHPAQPVTIERALGAILLIAGAFLVLRQQLVS